MPATDVMLSPVAATDAGSCRHAQAYEACRHRPRQSSTSTFKPNRALSLSYPRSFRRDVVGSGVNMKVSGYKCGPSASQNRSDRSHATCTRNMGAIRLAPDRQQSGQQPQGGGHIVIMRLTWSLPPPPCCCWLASKSWNGLPELSVCCCRGRLVGGKPCSAPPARHVEDVITRQRCTLGTWMIYQIVHVKPAGQKEHSNVAGWCLFGCDVCVVMLRATASRATD